MYFVVACRTTLLAMPEVQRSLQLLPLMEPTRCQAARCGGRCRGKVAPNSVARFCHYHLNNGGQHFSFPQTILTDKHYERMHLFNREWAARDEHSAHLMSRVNEMASADGQTFERFVRHDLAPSMEEVRRSSRNLVSARRHLGQCRLAQATIVDEREAMMTARIQTQSNIDRVLSYVAQAEAMLEQLRQSTQILEIAMYE